MLDTGDATSARSGNGKSVGELSTVKNLELKCAHAFIAAAIMGSALLPGASLLGCRKSNGAANPAPDAVAPSASKDNWPMFRG